MLVQLKAYIFSDKKYLEIISLIYRYQIYIEDNVIYTINDT